MIYEKKELEFLATKHAKENNLDPDLVFSIITVESGWDTFVSRFEPSVDKYVFNTLTHSSNCRITQMTEDLAQKHSYGLGQIMGFLAREMGHKECLSQLFIPEINLSYMCRFIKKQLERYGFETDAVAAYNAGSAHKLDSGMYRNQQYVDKVYKFLNAYRRLK